MSQPSNEPWIGLVHVRPISGSCTLGEGAKGAYAHVLVLAGGEAEYVSAVQEAMAIIELHAVGFDDVAPVTEYRKLGRVHGEVEELCSLLSPAQPVQYKTFDVYDRDDG